MTCTERIIKYTKLTRVCVCACVDLVIYGPATIKCLAGTAVSTAADIHFTD